MVRLNVRTAWQLAQTNSHLEISWRMDEHRSWTLEPVVATVVAWAWLGETFGRTQLVGGAVVIAEILVAQSAR